MSLPEHVFREYDIRGVADRDLVEPFPERLGSAYAETLTAELGRAPRVALCRDGRLSSPRIHAGLTAGLLAAGAEVLDIGVGPTPLLYFAAHHLDTDGAVQITGSQNPGEDNGFKMMRGRASFFGDDIQRLRERVRSPAAAAARAGEVQTLDVSDAYVEAIRKASRLPADPRSVRVVVDAGNGAAGPLGLRTLRALGFDVEPLHCEIDGRFPNHHPDPTVEENVAALHAAVKEHDAELGIALDGDADRVVIVDEKGNIGDGDQLMAVIAESWHRRGKLSAGGIVATVMSNLGLERYLKSHGLSLVRTPVGDRYVVEHMRRHGYNVGGEQSGHIVLSDFTTTGDGLVSSLQVLACVVATGKPVSEVCARFTPLPQVLQNVRYANGKPLDDNRVRRAIEGAKERLGDAGRLVIRPSGTEPVIRVMAEGDDEKLVNTVVGDIVEAVKAAAQAA